VARSNRRRVLSGLPGNFGRARPSKILLFYRTITALSRGLRDAHLTNLPLTMVPQLSNSTGDLRSKLGVGKVTIDDPDSLLQGCKDAARIP
jgi:hypothetical protein